MSDIPCPAPGCEVTWPSSTPTEVLIRLIDLHKDTAHPPDRNTHATVSTAPQKETKSSELQENVSRLEEQMEEMLKLKTLEIKEQENIHNMFRRLALLNGGTRKRLIRVNDASTEMAQKMTCLEAEMAQKRCLEAEVAQKLTCLEAEVEILKQAGSQALDVQHRNVPQAQGITAAASSVKPIPVPKSSTQTKIATKQKRYKVQDVEAMKDIQSYGYNSDTLGFPKSMELQDALTISENTCSRKESHQEFFTSENFQLQNLPEEYQDLQLVQTISLLSQMCVRISVGYISKERPRFIPHTKFPYPFYKRRGDRSQVRMGSGWVDGVSDDSVDIITSSQLVYDDSEALEMEVTFCVNGETVTCTEGSIKQCQPKSDLCQVTLKIKEKSFLVKMGTLKAEVDEDVKRMNKKYDSAQAIGCLVIMLSKPHGVGVTKIAVGKIINVSLMRQRLEYCNFESSVPTCVGCTGGLVWPVGWRRRINFSILALGVSHSERSDNNTQVSRSRWSILG